MIRYKSDLFGLRTLLLWDGSAAFRAIVPALVSTGLVLIYNFYWKQDIQRVVENTYTITVLLAFFSFLLTTRLNYSYERWWEATSMCHRLTSKLTDSAICLASFHYQAKIWEGVKPVTFGKTYAAGTEHATSQVERADPATQDEQDVVLVGSSQPLEVSTVENQTNASASASTGGATSLFRWFQQTLSGRSTNKGNATQTTSTPKGITTSNDPRAKPMSRSHSEPILATKSFKPNRKQVVNTKTGRREQVMFASQRNLSQVLQQQAFNPSPFLEEAVHLYSLLNAVAMASLRHDVEGCPSPLTEYIPNQPLPPYNPDRFQQRHGHLRKVPQSSSDSGALPSTTASSYWKEWWNESTDSLWNLFYFLAGLNRSAKQRTLYNAARPFHVLGGVSDHEVQRLQLARGPMAQVALCQLWLKEFIAREHLQGSTGDVAPPIVGFVYQWLTDAVAAYHHCRKIAYVPFPFPHEQMTSLFTLLIVFCFPVLYVGFVESLALGCALNFTTSLCFQGIYEVARELSNPYHTVPNDLPLNRFHAQFNESLRSLLTGYHPDWKPEQAQQQETANEAKN